MVERNNRVLLGMSGGVDSSVAALLLQKQGFEVIGITFLFSGEDAENHHFVNEARNLANQLKIKHLLLDLRSEFEELVVKYFIQTYQSGETPFPCAICNPEIKFKYLLYYANKEDCYYISTGHYVRTAYQNNQQYLFKGLDPDKDQTFFLWRLKRELVDRLIFPLGELTKTQTRQVAHNFGFRSLSQKRDSLGICFIRGNNYRDFLKERGIKSKPGYFIDHNNNILGRHSGIANYTIGQRRRLGLNLNYPVFVSKILPERNEIVLSAFTDLYRKKLLIRDYYFIDNQIIIMNTTLIVKVRYRLQETPCTLNILNKTRAEVCLLNSEAMISPGQTVVFYDGDRLVGGGFIETAS